MVSEYTRIGDIESKNGLKVLTKEEAATFRANMGQNGNAHYRNIEIDHIPAPRRESIGATARHVNTHYPPPPAQPSSSSSQRATQLEFAAPKRKATVLTFDDTPPPAKKQKASVLSFSP